MKTKTVSLGHWCESTETGGQNKKKNLALGIDSGSALDLEEGQEH